MKYIVILGDGMADLPCDQLGGKTPLEVAQKPNIDSLAKQGICGICRTVPDGMKPGSDVANLSVMGYSPLQYYSGRSPLEALSIGVDMADDDLAVRCNLVTLSDDENYCDKTMVDYSAGEISTEEAQQLIAAVQDALGNEENKFYSGVSYRHCLIKHHAEKGTDYTPPHDISGKVIGEYLPKGRYGEQMLALMKASYDVLSAHPINIKRKEQGKNPANSIWLWGEGSKPCLPDFYGLRGLKGCVISAVDLLKGIGIAGGLDVIDVPGVTGTVNTNFDGKAEACVKALDDGYDYVYLHMEAPDECGHQGDIDGKVRSIELIDQKVVGYILRELEGEQFRMLICPDHPTPLITMTHSSQPIPFVIYDSGSINQGVSAYTENECKSTGLMLDSGDQLVELFLNKDCDMKNKKKDILIEDSSVQKELADAEVSQNSDEIEIESAEIADTANAENDADIAGIADTQDATGNVDTAETEPAENEAVNAQTEAEQEIDADTAETAESEENAAETAESEENTTATAENEENAAEKSAEKTDDVEGNADDKSQGANDKEMTEVADDMLTSDDGEQQSGDKKAKKKAKKPLSPKAKKAVWILVAVAVLAVVVTAAVLTPILIINAPKVLISEAADFAKPVKGNKELYYLQKDITVDGDLTLGLNVDLNKKVLTVNGTLTIANPKGGNLLLGVKSGKEYTLGGKITAKKLVIKSAKKVDIYTNVSTDEFVIESVESGAAHGSIQANNGFSVSDSKMVFEHQLAFGEQIRSLQVANSDVVFTKATEMDIELTNNAKLRANSDVGNVTLDATSELRLYGSVYDDFAQQKLGSIVGGKLVFVARGGAFGLISDTDTVWVSKEALAGNAGIIKNVKHENYITTLDTPQFAVIERVGDVATLELSSVDSRAVKIEVTIDNSDPILFDVKDNNISTDGGYLYNLGDKLNTVGNHTIKIVLISNEPEFVEDSDPYYTEHMHYITLDKVGNARVTKNESGEYILRFNAVYFAETYEIVFDGVVINVANGANAAGDEIAVNLSGEASFKELLAVPGNHSIVIVAKSSKEGVNPSSKAYAKFPAITADIEKPALEWKKSDDGSTYNFSWKAVDNALRYRLVLTGIDKEPLIITTGANHIAISASEMDGYSLASLVAIGGDYYNDSEASVSMIIELPDIPNITEPA